MNICVFSASSSDLTQDYYDLAYRVGANLAKSGVGMVFGAGSMGLMGAAARGVHDNGGTTIGVIPERLHRPGVAYEHCSELIVTATMHERKAVMERLSSAFIVLPGGFGTLEELLEVLTLKQLGYIDANIVILNHNGFYDALLTMFRHLISENFAHSAYWKLFSLASTPEDAVRLALWPDQETLPDKISMSLGEK